VSEDQVPLAASDYYKNELIEDLGDGFEQLGSVESPYTLRVSSDSAPPEKLQRARALHADRPIEERNRDELRSDTITRDFDLWKNNKQQYDFPGVDTLSQTIQQHRAEAAAEIAKSIFNLSKIERDVEFKNPTVRGKYWSHPPKIELRTSETDFPGWRYPCALAHEIGHNADEQIKSRGRFYSDGEVGKDSLFETETQLDEARDLSERIRGEIIASDIPGTRNYRKKRSEMAADSFAAMILEPKHTRHQFPTIAKRFESVFDEFFESFTRERESLDKAWLSQRQNSLG